MNLLLVGEERETTPFSGVAVKVERGMADGEKPAALARQDENDAEEDEISGFEVLSFSFGGAGKR